MDRNIYALNGADGTKLWEHLTGYWVRTTPAVANGVVFVGSDDGNVYALNALHGVVRIGPLQRYAGMFHVGYGLDRQPFLGGRDCLHWCLVPSMIDLWASAAFGAFTAPCRTSSATLPLEAYPRTHFW